MICQIYSATSPAEALALVDAGVDYVGIYPVLAADYRGYFPGDATVGSEVSYDTALEIVDVLGDRATTVMLSLSDDPQETLSTVRALTPSVVQISGRTFRADARFRDAVRDAHAGTQLLHVVEVVDWESVKEAERLQGVADMLILDTGSASAIGASGRIHDWNVSRRIVEMSTIPVILAGGLDDKNVADAVRTVRPAGVDSFSLTNRYLPNGTFVKDIAKVRAFCDHARKAAADVPLAD
jgi:phosphoribosylanthranilate isomerase